MIDHKRVVETLKVKLGVKKVNFSKSDRKGGRSLWVCKVDNSEGVVEKLKELLEGGEVEGWELFVSGDRSVMGLKVMVG